MKMIDEPSELEKLLPREQPLFTIMQLARLLCVSDQHIYNLLMDEELETVPDLGRTGASRPMIRITRRSIVGFLQRRGQRVSVKPLSAIKAGVPRRLEEDTPGFSRKPPRVRKKMARKQKA